MAILDLTQFQEKYMEMVLLDGTSLNLKKPTQGIVIKMMAFEQEVKGNKKDLTKMLGVMDEMMLLILNHNKEAKVFTMADLGTGYTFEIQMAIIQGYTSFMNELNSAKN